MAVIERKFTFGDNRGTPFPEQRNIRTIACRYGSFIDAIVINGQQFGGNGGVLSKTFILDPGEYISTFLVNHGAVIDLLLLTTNEGREFRVGGKGGHSSVLKGKLNGLAGEIGTFKPGDPLVISRLTVWMETNQREPE